MKEFRKNIIKFIGIILLFLNISYLLSKILLLFDIDLSTLKETNLLSFEFLLELILTFIIIIFYRKYLQNDFITFKNDFKSKITLILKLFGIFFLIKIGSSMATYLLSLILNINLTVSENQDVISSIVSSSPLLMIFSASILAPIVEEGIFRLGLRKILKNNNLFIIISGLLFGFIHIFPTEINMTIALMQSINYIAMGITLAYIYVETDNIWYPITIHALNNFISLLLLMTT